MPIAHERTAWPIGWPSVTSRAYESAEMTSERRMSTSSPSAEPARGLTSTPGPGAFDQERKSARSLRVRAHTAAHVARPPGRGVRWWRLLHGGRQRAARRLRAGRHGCGAARRSASSRPRRATRTTTSSASTGTSRRRAASRRTCRCSGATAARRSPRSHLLEQDLVYVGGGCVRSMLGTWRAHGLDHVAAPGVGRRRGHVRAERRLAVLVRAGPDRVPRGAGAAGRRASGC